MTGKTVVITGATSGIGQVAAEKLASMGARIVQVARNRARGEAAMQRLAGTGHSIYYADLSRVGEMKRVAAEIAAAEPKIDVLINNAGAMFGSRELTEDGLEMTFATNHVAYFVLTDGLLGALEASGNGRVVNTASDAHRGASLDFNDLQAANDYSAFRVYGRSKLCNILFTRQLAARMKGAGITANSLHPGFVATRFGDESGGLVSWATRIAKNFAISPEKGAETIIHLASSPVVQGVTGQYFYQCRATTPTKQAQDDEAAKRLWDITARLASIET